MLGVAGPCHEEYNPATNKSSARAMSPKGLDHICAAVANGKFCVVGGFSEGQLNRTASSRD
jgi:hypothetical protein